jgi:hypothetical protein
MCVLGLACVRLRAIAALGHGLWWDRKRVGGIGDASGRRQFGSSQARSRAIAPCTDGPAHRVTRVRAVGVRGSASDRRASGGAGRGCALVLRGCFGASLGSLLDTATLNITTKYYSTPYVRIRPYKTSTAGRLGKFLLLPHPTRVHDNNTI